MINWPHKIKIKAKVFWEILFVNDLNDNNHYGEARPDERQIVLNNTQSPKSLNSTAIHEIIHAMDLEYKIGMTERMVLKSEKAWVYFLKNNKELVKQLIDDL